MMCLRDNIEITEEQFNFIIKRCLILVATNYARKKKSTVSDNLVNDIRNYFFGHFIPTECNSNDKLVVFVDNCSKIIDIFESNGFAFFAVNLIIKNLAPLIEKSFYDYFDAPLNKKELLTIGSTIKSISGIKNIDDYKIVMSQARNYIKKNNSDLNLYYWELKEYNKCERK